MVDGPFACWEFPEEVFVGDLRQNLGRHRTISVKKARRILEEMAAEARFRGR